jgi:hypothetical protein
VLGAQRSAESARLVLTITKKRGIFDRPTGAGCPA